VQPNTRHSLRPLFAAGDFNGKLGQILSRQRRGVSAIYKE
jgi:hypothetical protein